MKRSYYENTTINFIRDSPDQILSDLTQSHTFALEDSQRNSWINQIVLLKNPQHQGRDSFHWMYTQDMSIIV